MNPAQSQAAYFHNYPHRMRPHNPTYVSSFMTDSLSCLSPPSPYTIKIHKLTEYNSHFSPTEADRALLPRDTNFAKYSREAFEKNHSSQLSKYGSKLICDHKALW